jgi:hypothetical protein
MTRHGVDVDSTERRRDTPVEVYSHQLEKLQKLQIEQQRREKLLGYAKLATALLTAISAVLLIHHPAALFLLVTSIAGFVVFAVLHEKVLGSIRYRSRAITFYQRGLARLNDHWAGSGETGERFLDPMHPYARDLDLFGTASLFEFLCTARTRAGQETLADWLLAAAPVDEILARQVAVREMESRVDFRENLFSLGETVRLGVRPETLSAWGESKPILMLGSAPYVTTALTLFWILSLVAWGVWHTGIFALLTTVLNLVYYLRLHRRLEAAAKSVEEASEDLRLLAEILSLLEKEQFSSAKLLEIQALLKRDGIAPSVAIRKLARIVEYLESRRSPAMQLFDLLTFWSTFWSAQLVFMAERWQLEFGPAIRCWVAAVGEFEALTSLSGFAYEHPGYVLPDFVMKGPLFDAEGFAHPLLPACKAVENDLRLGDGPQLIILSGPNMAGKSTFIRSVGVNAVLAHCGAPVRARRLKLSPLNVGASICILDSLMGGTSRFYAEIHRVKLISDLAHGPVPVLFLLDELLSGTNSHDRLVGTQFVVQSLLEQDSIGIVSTHDLALTQIPQVIGARAINCHFEDRFGNGELIFDYKLKPGIVQTSNALELMRSIGLKVAG